LFTDGSCKFTFTPNALSAGAVVTLVDGTPTHGLYHAVGLLTSDLAHTSFFGEVTGLKAALELTAAARRAGRNTTISCDNMASVSSINRLLSTQQARWRSKWEAMWAHLLTTNHALDLLDVQRVKAHQSLHAGTLVEEAALIIGNMIADQVANKVVDYVLSAAGAPAAC
jgi:ribonuclease HI